MRKMLLGICLAVIVLPGWAGAADIDEITKLKKELELQRQQTEQLIERINQLDLKLREQEKLNTETSRAAKEETVNEAAVAAPVEPAAKQEL